MVICEQNVFDLAGKFQWDYGGHGGVGGGEDNSLEATAIIKSYK